MREGESEREHKTKRERASKRENKRKREGDTEGQMRMVMPETAETKLHNSHTASHTLQDKSIPQLTELAIPNSGNKSDSN